MSREEGTQTAAEMFEAVLGFIRRSLSFWKRSMLVFLLVAGVSVPMVFLKARSYRSETVVLYQENIKSEVLTGQEGAADNARRAAARLKEMLLSRASLEPIVKSIPRYEALADRRGMVDAVDELRSHISFQAREGDTFEIGYEGLSPEEAQDITKRLGDRIIQEAANRRAEQSKATKDYLEAQSEQNKAKLRTADQALWSFLTVHPEFIPLTLPGGGQKTVVVMPGAQAPTAGAVGKGDPVLAGLNAEAANIDRQLKAARGEAVPPPPSAPVTESAEVQAARKELAEKRAQFTDQHPDVVAARRRLDAAIEADKRRAAATQPAPLPTGKLSDADIQALEQRLVAVRRSIAARKGGGGGAAGLPAADPTSSAAVGLEVEFRRLQRDLEYLKEAQRQLDDKLFKAGLDEGASLNEHNTQVKIVDPAYLPAHPSSKPRSRALATYLGIGMVLALLLALVSARLDDRIYQRKDLEVLDILPVVGVIPRSLRRGG